MFSETQVSIELIDSLQTLLKLDLFYFNSSIICDCFFIFSFSYVTKLSIRNMYSLSYLNIILITLIYIFFKSLICFNALVYLFYQSFIYFFKFDISSLYEASLSYK